MNLTQIVITKNEDSTYCIITFNGTGVQERFDVCGGPLELLMLFCQALVLLRPR